MNYLNYKICVRYVRKCNSVCSVMIQLYDGD